MSATILNVEVKARSFSNEVLEEKAKSLGAHFHGLDHQIDTYFNVPNGRLKLREGNIEKSLIFYDRSNEKATRESNILFEKTNHNENLKAVLLGALGQKTVVDKKRKIYFIDNIKIHFDELEDLGQFVEVEAIDTTGEIGRDKLKQQCDWLVKEFELSEKDFVKYSYSDLINERDFERFQREALEYLESVDEFIDRQKLELSLSQIDHLCFRVTNESEYQHYKAELANNGELLVESIVGSRLIATYKLNKPIEYKNTEIDIVELPQPKINNKYALGFEHVEFVIEEAFEQFIEVYPDLAYDHKGCKKEVNPELRIIMPNGGSLKLHHQTLEQVIEYEKSIG